MVSMTSIERLLWAWAFMSPRDPLGPRGTSAPSQLNCRVAAVNKPWFLAEMPQPSTRRFRCDTALGPLVPRGTSGSVAQAFMPNVLMLARIHLCHMFTQALVWNER